MTNNTDALEEPPAPGMYGKMRDTAKHTVFFGIANILGRLLNFLLMPVYITWLGAELYGVLAMLMLVQILGMLLPQSVLIPSLFRSFYDYKDEKSRAMVVSTSFWLITMFSLLLCSVGLLLATPLSSLLVKTTVHAGAFRLVFLVCFMGAIGLPSLTVFRARKWSKRYLAVSVVTAIIQAGTSVFMVVVLKKGVWGVMFGTFVGTFLRTGSYLAMTFDSLKLQFSTSEARKMFSYGLPFLPGYGFTYVSQSSDRIFLGQFFSLAEVGVYAVGIRFAQLVNILLTGPFNFIQPAALFSAEKDHDANEFYAKTLTYLIFVGVFLSLGISALSREVIRIMAATAPEFWPAWRVVPILCLAFLFNGLRNVASPGLLLKRKTKLIPLTEGLGTIVNLALMFVLVRHFKGIGAGIAVATTFLTVCIARLYFSQRYLPVPWEWKRVVKAFLVGGALYAATFLVRVENIWLSMALKFPICLTYPLILYLIGFYEPAELRRMRTILRNLLARVRLRLHRPDRDGRSQ